MKALRVSLLSLVVLCLCLVPRELLAQAAPPTPAPANPHAGMAQQRPQDRNSPAADLPAGSIEATIADARGNPQANADVRLGILFQTIAEGESRESRTAKTNAEGRVRFDGLKVGSGFSYRITVRHGPADYGSTPFNLKEDAGQRLLVHVYPASSELSQTMQVGMRGFVYIEPRDDVFQFEVLFRVFNMGQVTWLPKNVVMDLPKGFKAFRANESMSDTRFEAVEGQGAKLLGTFSPGQHDLVFRFQMPKGSSDTASFHIGLPPRVAEMRVIAEANTNMRLDVDGFEPTQVDVAQSGERVLVTRKVLSRADEELGAFDATLSGLPVPSMGRWVAVLFAVVFAGAGALAAGGLLDRSVASSKEADEDRRRARSLLLDQLVELERARRAGELGPTAFERAHRQLLDAVARLSATSDLDGSKKPRRQAGKGASEASTA